METENNTEIKKEDRLDIPEPDPDVRQEVVASLEGARITIRKGVCQLDKYNFADNSWCTKDERAWPLSSEVAHQWLRGWNRVAQFKAFNMLVRPEPD